MSENAAAQNTDKTKLDSQAKVNELAAFEASLNKKLAQVSDIPIPGMGESWYLSPIVKNKGSNLNILHLFGKKKISDEELIELRKTSILQPGNTQTKVQKLKKQYPGNPELMMISAICTQGMMANSGMGKQLEGYKAATRDAGTALMSNGLSLYNAENFIKLYFMMLERYKREQNKVFDELRHDPRLQAQKQKMAHEMQLVDYLTMDRKKSLNILAHLKKKIKSSAYSQYFDVFSVAKACQMISDGKQKETLDFCSAGEFIAYLYALAIAFAKIPILSPLVDQILEGMNTSNMGVRLRRVSVSSVRHFSQLRIAAILNEQTKMKKLGSMIYQENLTYVKKMENAALYQVYETDPFFNLAHMAELTFGLYESSDQPKIVRNAIVAMETVIKKDMSPNHVFTELAKTHTYKLGELIASGETQSKTDSAEAPSKAHSQGLP